jgi:hypothetical protein
MALASVGADFGCQNALHPGQFAIVEIAMSNSVEPLTRSRRIRVAARFGFALVAAAFAPGAAIAAGQPLEIRVAYLDPGTGSLILQALVAALAGAVVAITSYWQRIRSFFRRSSRDKERSETTSSDD